jgi:hypothetical protein
LLPYLKTSDWLTIGCFLIILVFLSVRNFLVGFWAELSKNSVSGYQGMIAIVSFFAISIIWGTPLYRYVPSSAIYFAAWSALCLKFGTLAWVVIRQWRSGSLNPRFLAIVSVSYCLIVALMNAAVHRLISPPQPYGFLTPGLDYNLSAVEYSIIPLAVIFFVPIVRILLAPEMLALNRHRN